MSELKPCPFCGGEAQVHKFCDMCSVEINFKCKHDVSPDAACSIGGEVFWVEHECSVVHTEGIPLGTRCYATAREAIENWNTRTPETCSIAEHDELPYPVCSKCGAIQPDDYTVYYCWSCGRKVVEDD